MGIKKRKIKRKFTREDYLKAAQKAEREKQLAEFSVWIRTSQVHKSKKIYNRKSDKSNYLDE